MNAGLPGTGIGGIFYLLIALWMPFRELWLTCHGRSNVERWRGVGLQVGLSVGILLGLWAVGWLLAALLAAHIFPTAAGGMTLTATGHRALNVLRVSSIVLAFVNLCLVFLGVHILRWLTWPRSGRHRPALVHGEPRSPRPQGRIPGNM